MAGNRRRFATASLIGLSYAGVYFKDNVEICLARRLVGDKLQKAKERLPNGYPRTLEPACPFPRTLAQAQGKSLRTGSGV